MVKPFSVKIKIGKWENGSPEPGEEMEVLEDTGAAYTSLPRSLLSRMSIPIWGKKTLRLADGQLIAETTVPA